MKKQVILIGILGLAGMLAIFAGCAVQPAGSEEEVMVEITISQEMFTAKTIEPDISMDIKFYKLLYWSSDTTKPDESGFDYMPSTTTSVCLLLKPGIYDFQVKGYNAEDGSAAIGESDDDPVDTEVLPRRSVVVSLSIEPVDAKGDLKITVNWPAFNPALDATLTATIFNLDEVIPSLGASGYPAPNFYSYPVSGATTADIVGTLDDGYYKCVIQMVDDGPLPGDTSDDTVLWTTVEALRIISDYTSTETYDLDYQFDSLVIVNITQNMPEPHVDIRFRITDRDNAGVYFDDDGEPIAGTFYIIKGSNITVLAETGVPDKVGDDFTPSAVSSFEWYLNGSLFLTEIRSWSSSVTMGYSFLVGPNSLSVLVTSVDGTTASSRGLQFIVVPVAP